MSLRKGEYRAVLFVMLYFLTSTSGRFKKGAVQMAVIPLRPCPNVADKCVEIQECPKIALRFAKKGLVERRGLLQSVSCQIEYGALDVCCPLTSIVRGRVNSNEEKLLSRHPSLSLLNEEGCGKRRFFGNVGEFPWLAILMYEDKRTGSYRSGCGGSLISKRHVLTAAHCLWDSRRKPLPMTKVSLGGFGRTSEQYVGMHLGLYRYVSPMEYGVENVFHHQEYDSSSYANDIGLVTLNKTVYYSDFIQPICLPLPDSAAASLQWKSNMKLILAGWQLNDINNGGDVSSDHWLRKSELEYLKPSDCRRHLKTWIMKVDAKQFCTRSRGRNICAGDSGGPIMKGIMSQYGSTIIYQVGIVSHTYGRCNESAVTLHTNVQPYLRWILDTIGIST